MFTEAVRRLNLQDIQHAIATDGYFAIERALEPSFVDAMVAESGELVPAVNVNDVHGVQFGDQAYMTHCLAKSRSVFQLVTSDFVMDVCKTCLGDEFYLHAKRVYSTSYGHHMQWHTDNKRHDAKLNFPGLIFIVYLCDVVDGEFQYVRGSHEWSGNLQFSDYSDKYIEDNHAADVKSFALPRGSVIFYNIYGVHRAKPIVTPGWTRTSLFFSVSGQYCDGEKLLVDTSFIDRCDERLQRFLRFGKRPTFDTFPGSDIDTLTLPEALALQAKLARKVPAILARHARELVPNDVRLKVASMLGLRPGAN